MAIRCYLCGRELPDPNQLCAHCFPNLPSPDEFYNAQGLPLPERPPLKCCICGKSLAEAQCLYHSLWGNHDDNAWYCREHLTPELKEAALVRTCLWRPGE